MSVFRLIVLYLLVSAQVQADDRTRIREIPAPPGMQLVGGEDNATSKVYIVQLKSPSAADVYAASKATVSGKRSGSAPAAFDKTSAAVQTHARRLEDEQRKVLQSVGTGTLYVMKGGELYEGDTLDMIWPREEPLRRFKYVDFGPPPKSQWIP